MNQVEVETNLFESLKVIFFKFKIKEIDWMKKMRSKTLKLKFLN